MKKVISSTIQKPVQAAEGEQGSDKLQAALDNLNDDFDYIISGLERLERQGANGANDAMMIAENLSGALQSVMSEVASHIGE